MMGLGFIPGLLKHVWWVLNLEVQLVFADVSGLRLIFASHIMFYFYAKTHKPWLHFLTR